MDEPNRWVIDEPMPGCFKYTHVLGLFKSTVGLNQWLVYLLSHNAGLSPFGLICWVIFPYVKYFGLF